MSNKEAKKIIEGAFKENDAHRTQAYEVYLGNYDAMQTVTLRADAHNESDSHIEFYRLIGKQSDVVGKFKLDTVLGWAIQG